MSIGFNLHDLVEWKRQGTTEAAYLLGRGPVSALQQEGGDILGNAMLILGRVFHPELGAEEIAQPFRFPATVEARHPGRHAVVVFGDRHPRLVADQGAADVNQQRLEVHRPVS